MPITPQESLAPAWPVVKLSSWPPFPRSSSSAWTWNEHKPSGTTDTQQVPLIQQETHHHGAPNYVVRASEWDLSVSDVHRRNTVPVGIDVSQVACMPLCVSGATVLLAKWIEVGSSADAPYTWILTNTGLA